MAEDMQLRNLAPSTIDAYTFQVDKFCQYFGKPADQLGPEEKRRKKLPIVLSNVEACRLRSEHMTEIDRLLTPERVPPPQRRKSGRPPKKCRRNR
jgi:hypothetical protein